MFRIRARAARRQRGPLSIWQPVELGIDERGVPVRVGLAERNLIAAGEPGAGKSVGLNLIVAHAASNRTTHQPSLPEPVIRRRNNAVLFDSPEHGGAAHLMLRGYSWLARVRPRPSGWRET